MTTEKAILAGGCFWGLQDLIRKRPGVLTTRVGYTGGDVPNATYRNHRGHAEAMEITFDPDKTYELQELIDIAERTNPQTRSAWERACQAAAKRLSALNFTADGVEVRNFPGRTRRIPLAAIDRFDQATREGARARVPFGEALLLLTDGSRLKVRRLGDPDLGTGVTGLNNRLEHMRRSAVGE